MCTVASIEIEKAIQELKKGRPVLVYDSDDRERETDIVVASQFVTSDIIHLMRSEGGGLICTTVDWDSAEKLGLPYLADLFQNASDRYPTLKLLIPNDIPYDEISSFSLTINARDTFTGITDNDRSKTIKKFAELLHDIDVEELETDAAREKFGREFRSPGHVHLLRTSKNPLTSRFGHTELSTALVTMAGLTRSATICEMMGEGGSRPPDETRKFARENNYVWLSGDEVVEAWNKWSQ